MLWTLPSWRVVMNNKTLGSIFVSLCIIIISIFMAVYAGSMLDLLTRVLGCSLVLYSIYNLFVEYKKKNRSLSSITGGTVILIIGLVYLIMILKVILQKC